MTLAEGLRFERRIFHGLFATNDQKEGAFISLQVNCVLVAYWRLDRHGCICGKETGQLYTYLIGRVLSIKLLHVVGRDSFMTKSWNA